MKKKKIIDISTEEKRKDVFEKFSSFTSKNQAHNYFGISDNKQGSDYLKEIAKSVGFDLSSYKTKNEKETRYCKQCGKEITSRWGRDFCCSSCAVKYNNSKREPDVYRKVGDKLRKCKPQDNPVTEKTVEKPRRFCKLCGKEILNGNKKFCSRKCSNEGFRQERYEHFLEHPEEYCRGNYTPRWGFRDNFMEEQNGVCAICGSKPEHNGKPLVFVLDHIDGDASNNRRENLRMICPNCDSQLPTFKSKNKNSTRRNYWKDKIIKDIKG